MKNTKDPMMNTKRFNKNFITSKIAQAVMSVGAFATVMSCTMLFHEKQVPKELLKNHPFAEKN